jgi:hypothetical protein
MSDENVTEQPKKIKDLDPYEMLKQIESLRADGIDEPTIREAFNQYMAERQGIFKKTSTCG